MRGSGVEEGLGEAVWGAGRCRQEAVLNIFMVWLWLVWTVETGVVCVAGRWSGGVWSVACVCWKVVGVVWLSGVGCWGVWESIDLGWRYVMDGGVEQIGCGFVAVRISRGAALCQVSRAQSRDETSAHALRLRGFAWNVCRVVTSLKQRELGFLLKLTSLWSLSLVRACGDMPDLLTAIWSAKGLTAYSRNQQLR